MDLKTAAAGRWVSVNRLEKSFLKQKSKLHWFNIGDGNNQTFHQAVDTREATNYIKEVICRDGTFTRDESEIKMDVFFNEFLQHKPYGYEGMEVDKLEDLLLPFRLSETDSHQLLLVVSRKKIKDVLFGSVHFVMFCFLFKLLLL